MSEHCLPCALSKAGPQRVAGELEGAGFDVENSENRRYSPPRPCLLKLTDVSGVGLSRFGFSLKCKVIQQGRNKKISERDQ